jgi:hypothetical protein
VHLKREEDCVRFIEPGATKLIKEVKKHTFKSVPLDFEQPKGL